MSTPSLGAQSVSYLIDTGAHFVGLKKTERESHRSPLSIAVAKEEWSHTSTTPQVFMARVILRGNKLSVLWVMFKNMYFSVWSPCGLVTIEIHLGSKLNSCCRFLHRSLNKLNWNILIGLLGETYGHSQTEGLTDNFFFFISLPYMDSSSSMQQESKPSVSFRK